MSIRGITDGRGRCHYEQAAPCCITQLTQLGQGGGGGISMENGSKIALHGILVGHVEHPGRRRVGELPQKTGVRPGGEDVSRQKMQIRCRESVYVPEVQA